VECAADTYKPEVGRDACTDCVEGTFTEGTGSTAVEQCLENCAPGSTAAADGGPGCEECAADTHKAHEGRKACAACPEGTDTEGRTGGVHIDACLEICAPGFTADPDSSGCVECAENTFKAEDGRQDCNPCLENFFTEGRGNVAEDACLENCSPGSEAAAEGPGCEACVQNTYKAEEGRQACTPCHEGAFTEAEGSTSVDECLTTCPPGFTAGVGHSGCDECALNTYKPDEGRQECTPCAEDTFTEDVASTAVEQCLENCEQGFTAAEEGPGCVECVADTHKPHKGRDACVDCPAGTTTEGRTAAKKVHECVDICALGAQAGESGDCENCPADTYSDVEGRDACIPCPEGTSTYGVEGAVSVDACAAPTTVAIPTTTTDEIAPPPPPVGPPMPPILPPDLLTPCDEGCHPDAECNEEGLCECPYDQRCGDGVYVCKAECVCRVMGDPVVNTDDGQEIILTEPGLYKMSQDQTDPEDPCSFSVSVKVTPVVRQQRIEGATSMPRYLRIEFCGYVIHLDQNFRAMVGEEEIELAADGSDSYTSPAEEFDGQCQFSISKVTTEINGEQSFIILESETCGFHVGFEGDGTNSVAVIKRRCNPHGGRMIGLCGDCNGLADDLRTCDTGTDVAEEADPFQIVSESCRIDDTFDEWVMYFREDGGEPVGPSADGSYEGAMVIGADSITPDIEGVADELLEFNAEDLVIGADTGTPDIALPELGVADESPEFDLGMLSDFGLGAELGVGAVEEAAEVVEEAVEEVVDDAPPMPPPMPPPMMH